MIEPGDRRLCGRWGIDHPGVAAGRRINPPLVVADACVVVRLRSRKQAHRAA